MIHNLRTGICSGHINFTNKTTVFLKKQRVSIAARHFVAGSVPFTSFFEHKTHCLVFVSQLWQRYSEDSSGDALSFSCSRILFCFTYSFYIKKKNKEQTGPRSCQILSGQYQLEVQRKWKMSHTHTQRSLRGGSVINRAAKAGDVNPGVETRDRKQAQSFKGIKNKLYTDMKTH